MSSEKKLQIRNSTAEFLIFTRQSGENSIEVRVAKETVWLSQKRWVQSYVSRHGKYPEQLSGTIEEAPQETWGGVDSALVGGYRGLPAGSSLAKLRQSLVADGKLPDLEAPQYSIETIAGWLRAHGARHGEYPSVRSGTVEDAPNETWIKVHHALRRGHRGLPGGTTLAKFKQDLIREGRLPSLSKCSHRVGPDA
jgi:hypothetical protein